MIFTNKALLSLAVMLLYAPTRIFAKYICETSFGWGIRHTGPVSSLKRCQMEDCKNLKTNKKYNVCSECYVFELKSGWVAAPLLKAGWISAEVENETFYYLAEELKGGKPTPPGKSGTGTPKSATWTRPDLPAGWKSAKTENGKTFYYLAEEMEGGKRRNNSGLPKSANDGTFYYKKSQLKAGTAPTPPQASGKRGNPKSATWTRPNGKRKCQACQKREYYSARVRNRRKEVSRKEDPEDQARRIKNTPIHSYNEKRQKSGWEPKNAVPLTRGWDSAVTPNGRRYYYRVDELVDGTPVPPGDAQAGASTIWTIPKEYDPTITTPVRPQESRRRLTSQGILNLRNRRPTSAEVVLGCLLEEIVSQ